MKKHQRKNNRHKKITVAFAQCEWVLKVDFSKFTFLKMIEPTAKQNKNIFEQTKG